jgi:hypothetical protein
MFENEDDATRFGLMLEAQDFPEATVEAIDQEDIEDFCESAGYECRLVPEGYLALPPENRVEQTDGIPTNRQSVRRRGVLQATNRRVVSLKPN